MRVGRLRDTPANAAGSEHFTGAVIRNDLVSVDEPMSSALLVRFEAGARSVFAHLAVSLGETHWGEPVDD